MAEKRERRKGTSKEGESAWAGEKIKCSERTEEESSRKETAELRVCRETRWTDKQRGRKVKVTEVSS